MRLAEDCAHEGCTTYFQVGERPADVPSVTLVGSGRCEATVRRTLVLRGRFAPSYGRADRNDGWYLLHETDGCRMPGPDAVVVAAFASPSLVVHDLASAPYVPAEPSLLAHLHPEASEGCDPSPPSFRAFRPEGLGVTVARSTCFDFALVDDTVVMFFDTRLYALVSTGPELYMVRSGEEGDYAQRLRPSP